MRRNALRVLHPTALMWYYIRERPNGSCCASLRGLWLLSRPSVYLLLEIFHFLSGLIESFSESGSWNFVQRIPTEEENLSEGLGFDFFSKFLVGDGIEVGPNLVPTQKVVARKDNSVSDRSRIAYLIVEFVRFDEKAQLQALCHHCSHVLFTLSRTGCRGD